MKLRISRDLHARARACAEAVGDTLDRWVNLALKKAQTEALADYVPPPEMLTADSSTAVITLASTEHCADLVRYCIAKAVLYCEARNPRPYTPDLKEGRDYLIARPAE